MNMLRNMKQIYTTSLDIVSLCRKIARFDGISFLIMQTSLNREQSAPAWVQAVQNQIGSLRFGVVQIVVHDSRVVQIERTSRVRLDRPDGKTLSPAQVVAL
jgi:hypothetical protein